MCSSRDSPIISAFSAIRRRTRVRSLTVKKAAAHGRRALALLRAPPRAPCLPRQLCSGGSAILQMRRAANRGAGGRPDWPRRAVPDGSEERRWTAVMAPRHAELGADDAVASHRAADGAGPSIEAARTHASGSSRGAAAVSRALGPPQLVLTRPLPFLPKTLACGHARGYVSRIFRRRTLCKQLCPYRRNNFPRPKGHGLESSCRKFRFTSAVQNCP